MTDRDLSLKLEELAGRIEGTINALNRINGLRTAVPDELGDISAELRFLANQKYTPGSVSWDDVKNQSNSTKNRFPF